MASKPQHKLLKYSTRLYGGWVVAIALLTLLPGSVVNFIDWNFLSIDKLAHITMFGVMSWLGGFSFRTGRWPAPLTARPALTSLLAALAYGTLLEFSQSLVPQRTFDLADLTANFSGALLGLLLYKLTG